MTLIITICKGIAPSFCLRNRSRTRLTPRIVDRATPTSNPRPHPVLEREVAQIIGSLPKMKPGRQRGKPVGVSYSIPITFEVR